MGGGVYGPVPNVLGFIVVFLTGWFWLALIALAGTRGSGLAMIFCHYFLSAALLALVLPLLAMLQAGHALKLVRDRP